MPSTAFTNRLTAYKQAIDAEVAAYATYARSSARSQFGEYAGLEVDLFLDMLTRGGKRIRGALVMHGYEMCGGTNRSMILQAARAIEMMHAYMLIIDDIQDRSRTRRGKPTIHEELAAYHQRHHLKGDVNHAAISLGLNVAIAGNHAAQIILANMDVDPQLRLNVLSITNRTLMITAHGQMYDIMNQLVDAPDPADIDRVLEWKTALYSFINPLHVGMVLAGADCRATDAITPYALHTGRAFQLTDDILGIFGTEKQAGKSPKDDLTEGKQTPLIAYAVAHAAPADAAFLKRMLGNTHLTGREFTRCRNIIRSSGALAVIQAQAQQEIVMANQALDTLAVNWRSADVEFLRDLADFITHRTA
jgi:geranylgeranyl diphosphate synthase, type I